MLPSIFPFPRRSSCVLHDSDTLYFVYIPLFPPPPPPPSHFYGWSYFVIWASPFLFYLSPLAFSRLPIRINVWNKVFSLLFYFCIWYRRQLKMLPSWEASKTGSMSFKIRTNEPNGLLLYNNGAPHAQVCVVCRFSLCDDERGWIHIPSKIHCSYSLFDCLVTYRVITSPWNWSTVTSTSTWIWDRAALRWRLHRGGLTTALGTRSPSHGTAKVVGPRLTGPALISSRQVCPFILT